MVARPGSSELLPQEGMMMEEVVLRWAAKKGSAPGLDWRKGCAILAMCRGVAVLGVRCWTESNKGLRPWEVGDPAGVCGVLGQSRRRPRYWQLWCWGEGENKLVIKVEFRIRKG